MNTPTAAPMREDVTQFEREERYIVFKKSHLSGEQIAKLERLTTEGYLSSSSHDHPMPTVECVVVEADWPEYEHVWRVIEQRMADGSKQVFDGWTRDEYNAMAAAENVRPDAGDEDGWRNTTCPTCEGSGHGNVGGDCFICEGTGRIRVAAMREGVDRGMVERTLNILDIAANYSDAVANGGEFADPYLRLLETMNGDVIAEDRRKLAAALSKDQPR